MLLRLKLIVIGAALLGMSACATSTPKDYTSFRDADPHSILVVPVINNSNEAEAADLFLTTLPVPLAERGYYVFPVNMVKVMMEEDGLGDAFLVHSADPTRVAELFGAESVLFVEIESWESNYSIIASNITVKLSYTLKEANGGTTIWQDVSTVVANRSSSSGSIIADLIANAIVAAMDSARADYTDVAVLANRNAFLLAGRGLPFGPYNPGYRGDAAAFPSSGLQPNSVAPTTE